MADSHVDGSLRTDGGRGIVRLEAHVDAGVEDVWAALTDRSRLSRWLGELDGDLRAGGEFRARFSASGWEGTGRVEVCEAPRRLMVATSSPDEPDGAFDVTLTAEDGGTVLVVEDRNLPLAHLAAYGAGDQIHLEDLTAHLAGRDRCDPRARFAELHPAYEDLAAALPSAIS